MRNRNETHGLVLGGGLAGVLAAAVLAKHADVVTVVERDRVGDESEPRKGLPQSQHAHLLLSRGARTIDALLPGTTRELLARGAHRIGMPADILTFTPQGWMPRFPEVQFLISCSRGLTDAVVRKRALRDERITVVPGSDAVGLTGNAGRVTGALIRNRDTNEVRSIAADLVVDATGSSSKATQWLVDLGLPAARQEVVDAGVGYATRLFRLPVGAGNGFPALYVQADPAGAGQGGVLLPIEGDRWILSVSGVRGAEPPTDGPGLADFTAKLRHPILSTVLAEATPLGPVRGYRNLVNRWRKFEQMSAWPEGLVVLGDAARTFNPAYGHGMSVAAVGVQQLQRALDRSGFSAGLAKQVQRAAARAADDAWALATGQDIRYERTIGARPGILGRQRIRHGDLIGRAAAARPDVTAALLNAYTLSAPLTTLLAPRIALAALRRSGSPSLTPPFTPQEVRLLAEISARTRRTADE